MKNLLTTFLTIALSYLCTTAQTPYLFKDIISGPAGGMAQSSQYVYYSHPFEVVWEKNGIIYFTAVGYNTVPTGGAYTNDVELWQSDGTASGTFVLKDIYPGNEGSFPSEFVEINGTLYFTAYNPSSGKELWKTDGTSAGTVIVKEIINGAVGGFQTSGQWGYNSFPFSVVWQNGGVFYFMANSYASAPGNYIDDVELWRSDGTDAGTYVVKDIYPGLESSFTRDFHAVNGTLYFTALNATSGRELWRTDGTNSGTYIVKEIISGSVGGFETSGQWGYNLHIFSVVWQQGNTFYFTANSYASPPGNYVDDIELWRSDGTDAGTYAVKDIYPGLESSFPRDFHEVNGTLYFTAYNSSTGRELWRSDGTNGGTYIVKEIISGNVGGFETSGQWGYNLHIFSVVWQQGNTFYFTANNYASPPGNYIDDIELWKSDGTSGGTQMVKDIYTGLESSYPQDFHDINGTLYFTAYNASSGRELWKTDGSNGGTTMVKEFIAGGVGGFQTTGQWGYNSFPFRVVWQNGGTFYFTASNYASTPGNYIDDIELWKSDGTNGGTIMVKDIYTGNEGSYPSDFRDISGSLYFTAYNPSSGREMWKSDGTIGGTQMVAEIMSGNVGGFSVASQYVYETWAFNVVFNIGSYFYFTANDYATVPIGSGYENNIELWRSDGTSGGTSKVIEIFISGTEGSYPAYFTNRLGKIFFTANNAANGRELWVIDMPVSNEPEFVSSINWKVFPNPANNSLQVIYSSPDTGNPMENITITDIHGRAVYHYESDKTDTFFNTQIDISSLAPGIYFVKLTTAQSTETIKIIKE